MTAYYAHILVVHLTAVAVSGALFAVRGVAAMAGLWWATSRPVRYVSYTIDTVLLVAALMLVAILPAEVFANHWLTAKLVLVVTYIVLGVFAMRPGRSLRMRVVCYVAALLVFTTIAGVAYTHDPLGWLVWYGLF